VLILFVGPGTKRWNFKIREQFWYKLIPYLFKLLPYLLVNPTVKISLLTNGQRIWLYAITKSGNAIELPQFIPSSTNRKFNQNLSLNLYREIQIQSKSHFEFVPRDTEEFEFLHFDYATKISLPFRISICMSFTISSLVFSETGCKVNWLYTNDQVRQHNWHLATE